MANRTRTPKYEIILKKLPEEDYSILVKKLEKLDKTKLRVSYLATKFKLSRSTANAFYTAHFEAKLKPASEPQTTALKLEGGESEYYNMFYTKQRLIFYSKYKKYITDPLLEIDDLFRELLLRTKDLRAIFFYLTRRIATTNNYDYLYAGIQGAVFNDDPEMQELCTTDKPRHNGTGGDDPDDRPASPARPRGRPRTRPQPPPAVSLSIGGETLTIGDIPEPPPVPKLQVSLSIGGETLIV